MDKAADYQLLLYAVQGQAPAPVHNAQSVLIDALANMGFLGVALAGREGDYLTGDHFTDLVTFLGCSPEIALQPEEDKPYCFIRMHQPTETLQLFSGKNTRPPSCKACKNTQPQWRNALDEDYCASCSVDDRAHHWTWKKTGALGRWAVSIFNVYPNEAIPAPQLMGILAECSGVDWSHAYI